MIGLLNPVPSGFQSRVCNTTHCILEVGVSLLGACFCDLHEGTRPVTASLRCTHKTYFCFVFCYICTAIGSFVT